METRQDRRHTWRQLLVAGLVAGGALAASAEPLPPSPPFVEDLRGFDQVGTGYQLTSPYVPPLSTSQDRRIGLMRKSKSSQLRFALMKPEQLAGPLLAQDGAAILDETLQAVPLSLFHGAQATGEFTPIVHHSGICDPQEATPNPYLCFGDHDCYRLFVITGAIFSDTVQNPPGETPDAPYLQMWSTPVTIEVANPKTANAHIVNVTVHTDERVAGPPIFGLPPQGINTFHTPLFVGDNRLMVVRLGFYSHYAWQGAGGLLDQRSGHYDTSYAYYPDGAQCDVSRWTSFKPLSYAPADPNVNSRFGFAKNPFRSPSGAALPTDFDFGGRYPWVDQKANNIFFTTLSRGLIDRSAECQSAGNCQHTYDIACVPGSSCTDPRNLASEETPPHQGWMMMGLWTHGKMVLLDSVINHADFGLRARDEHHRLVTLFEDNGVPLAVEVGAGRDEVTHADFPPGWIDTTVQLGSTENFLSLSANMATRSPRDVVWQVSAGVRTAEIAFDDYLSHRTLIYSPMNALREMVGLAYYYDGNEPAAPEMRLQNAATTLDMAVPPYGRVESTSTTDPVRIENVAVGGIEARGFYLAPGTRLSYDIPSQSGLDGKEWLVSIFYDLEVVSSQVRRLFTLPNGDYIDLHGLWQMKICDAGGGGCTSLRLPKAQVQGSWMHLAFHLDPALSRVRVFQNGFLFAEVRRHLTITPGSFRVGSPDLGVTPGAAGWIDELKVVAGPFHFEEICNHARGSLVAVPSTYLNAGNALGNLLSPYENLLADDVNYPDSATLTYLSGRLLIQQALHDASAGVVALADHYACNVDYSSPAGIAVDDPGDPQARPLRRRLLFPEGPISWNQPRPASVANQFCLSCHEAGGKGGLSLDALTLMAGTAAVDDARRQPSQPPVRLLGALPADYFAPGAPAALGVDGLIDPYLLNGPLYHWKFDEVTGAKLHNAVIGDVTLASTDATRGTAIYRPGAHPTASRAHCLEFDGDDVATVDNPINIAGDALTLAAFFRPHRTGGPATPEAECPQSAPCTLVAKSGAAVYWSLQAFYNPMLSRWQAKLEVRRGGTLESLTANLPAGFNGTQWHHLAGLYGDGQLEIYLDGNLAGSATVAGGNLDTSTSSSHPVTFGGQRNAAGGLVLPLRGRLDEVRIYDRRLRPEELVELATSTP